MWPRRFSFMLAKRLDPLTGFGGIVVALRSFSGRREPVSSEKRRIVHSVSKRSWSSPASPGGRAIHQHTRCARASTRIKLKISETARDVTALALVKPLQFLLSLILIPAY